MAHITISPEADTDTAAILDDLAIKAGARVADRYEAEFDTIYNRLAAHPECGAPRPRLGKHVRICVAPPYVVFYEHLRADDRILILRIAHGRRKITRKFVRGKVM